MAHRNSSSKTRHAAPSRRTQKRRTREETLQHELELREHSPLRPPSHRARKITKSRAPFWKIVRRGVTVLAFLGFAELGVASLTAKPFRVRSLDVAGCELTNENQVLETSRVLVGQNWIRAKTKTIEAELQQMPTVKIARVSRVLDWPPRLHVQIEEREAFAKVGAGEKWWVVDESGVAFRRANEKDKNLYAVTSPKMSPHLGSALPEKDWRPVVEIAGALKTEGNQSWSLRRIYFDKDGSASLRLAGGFHDETLVRLGSDHWNEKLLRARQALAFFEGSGKRAKVLNFVSYEMPQWTPRAPQAPAPSTASTPAIAVTHSAASDT